MLHPVNSRCRRTSHQVPQQPDFGRYETAVANVRAQLVAYAATVWASTKFTDAAMARLVELMVPKVMSGQLVVANLTSAYLAQATGTKPLPVSDAVTKGRGVEPSRVYERPIITTRTQVSKGKPVPKALEAGGQRLESLVTTDLQMAKVRQANASLAHAGRKYYRRVPKGAHTCAMCLIASTQRYNGKRLMPIHPGCDCGVDVIPPGMDLDLVIDESLLEATHQKVHEVTGVMDRGGRAPDYRKLLITREHGELGPVLTWRGQKFTSLDQLK